MAFIVRMAEPKDLDDIYQLSQSAVLFNLPPDKNFLKQLIELSIQSVSNVDFPKTEALYLFVLEDLSTSKIIGTSQIKAQKTHDKRANYTFQILQEKKYSHSLDIFVNHKKIKLIEDWEPLTELGGLVIEKNHQGSSHKLGKLLSFSRFFYITQFTKRFNERLYVEIAPKSHALWESLSSKFIPLTYQEADLKSKKNQEFFSALLPKEDIYLSLLSEEAQKDIAQTSKQSFSAMKILEKAGFVYREEVDPFDGGICLRGRVQHLPFYNSIVKVTMHTKDLAVGKDVQANNKFFLLSVGSEIFFRCLLVKPCFICYEGAETKLYCKPEVFDSLQIKSGESVNSFKL